MNVFRCCTSRSWTGIFMSLVLVSLVFCSSAPAQSPFTSKKLPALAAPVTGKVTQARPVNVQLESVEFVTTADDTHFWQVSVKNLSNFDVSNFHIYAQVICFRKQDNSQVMTGTIARLEAGRTGYARGPLPSIEGMHILAVKAGGPIQHIPIPRPFRLDMGGNPAAGLEINKTWSRKIGDRTFWYLETKPNRYGMIHPGKAFVFSQTRGRKHKWCHEEQGNVWYNNSYISNTAVIQPGQAYVFSAEITANPHPDWPPKFDYIKLTLNKREAHIKMDSSYWSGYKECDLKMQYPK